jgi:hypothetical protein
VRPGDAQEGIQARTIGELLFPFVRMNDKFRLSAGSDLLNLASSSLCVIRIGRGDLRAFQLSDTEQVKPWLEGLWRMPPRSKLATVAVAAALSSDTSPRPAYIAYCVVYDRPHLRRLVPHPILIAAHANHYAAFIDLITVP